MRRSTDAEPVGAAGMSAAHGRRPAQRKVAAVVVALLLAGAGWLGANYGPRQAALFLVGAGCGFVLYHAAFGFTTAFRVFVTDGDGYGLRAQMLMLAAATVLFAPMLAAGQVLGRPVSGAAGLADGSVVAGAFMFAIGMQVGGG